MIAFPLTDDERDRDLGVLLDDGGNRVDVSLVLVKAIVGDSVLSVGRKRRAVTVGQVVDYESANDGWRSTGGILRLDVSEVGVNGRDLGRGITVCDQHGYTQCGDL